MNRPHARAHQRGLAAAGLAGDAEHLARGELKRDAVHGLHSGARAGQVVHAQIRDLEDGIRRALRSSFITAPVQRKRGLNTLSIAVFTM